MSAKSGLSTKELTEFCDSLEMTVMKRFPAETQRFMRSEGDKLKNHAKKYAKERVGKKTGNYLKGFKTGKKVYEYDGNDYNIVVSNDAPHAHLIEEGHVMTKHGGKNVGYYGRGHAPKSGTKEYIPGLFILRDSSIKFEPIFAKDIEDELVDEVLKDFL